MVLNFYFFDKTGFFMLIGYLYEFCELLTQSIFFEVLVLFSY